MGVPYRFTHLIDDDYDDARRVVAYPTMKHITGNLAMIFSPAHQHEAIGVEVSLRHWIKARCLSALLLRTQWPFGFAPLRASIPEL